MAKTFQTRRRVEFRDTDAAGIVHFSVFFNYMEQAEHEFLRHLGLSVMPPFHGDTIAESQAEAREVVSWPRVSAHCDYRLPLRFEDVVEIEVFVTSIGNKSVNYGFLFQRENSAIAEGHFVTVCCQVAAGRSPISVPIPDDIRSLLQPYEHPA